ncbi:oligosaccharide flippase family protein [Gordonia ajococcus]|uniref:oligosaccharide flippase family protein n=1 Tax=Gordonia ajococcus TaxID=1292359 RepID=UPI001787589D|nr:oligosaccharide flippase family protein [Gordonia ajococcus]
MTNLAAAGARGGLVTASSQIINLLIRTVTIVIFARIFAPEVFGFVAVVTAINMFVTAIVALGLPAAAMQARDLSHQAASALLYVSSFIGAVCAMLLVIGASTIASLFDASQIETVMYWLAAVPFLMGFQSQFRVQMMRQLQFTTLAVIEVVSTVLGTAIAIVYALATRDYVAIAVQALAPVVLQTVLVALLARWWPTRPGNQAEVRHLLKIGVQAFGIGILQHASRQLLVPAIALDTSPAEVGAYDRAQQLAVMPVNSVVDQLQRVAIPVLAQLRDVPDRMRAYLARAQLVVAYTIGTGFFVLSSVSTEFVVLLLGNGWLVAGQLLQVLAIGAAFRALAQTVQWQFIAQGATSQGLKFSLWSQPGIAALSVAGLVWGIQGVAVMNTLAWALVWPAATIAACRASNFSWRRFLVEPLRALTLFALPAAIPGFALSATELDPIVKITASLLLSLATCVMSYQLIPAVRNDVRIVALTAKLSIGKSQ